MLAVAPPRDRLEAVWRRSDALFALVEDATLFEQPIPLRQPLVFYLGHLPAFALNQLWRGHQGRPSFRSEFDALFARGIDPVGVDAHVPPSPERWPPVAAVREYGARAREALRQAAEALDERRAADREVLGTVVEHEMMHHETLLYMLQRLPPERKARPGSLAYRFGPAVRREQVEVSAGCATLGAGRDEIAFGWDNEFERHVVEVPAFRVDSTPVTNAELLEFVAAGGYARPELWSEDDWAWRARTRLVHPPFWVRGEDGYRLRTLFDDLPLGDVSGWPAWVSWAEARAFTRFRGARLPSEAELARAAFANPEGGSRPHPWGEQAPEQRHGNFGWRHWAPTPVGSHPDGASGFGVHELVGNGWEWTRTVFAPFPGFAARPSYPGYSADFFDGRHHVMLGASFATDDGLVRRSFRNWFQPHYPHVFAKFRCVRPARS